MLNGCLLDCLVELLLVLVQAGEHRQPVWSAGSTTFLYFVTDNGQIQKDLYVTTQKFD